MGSIVGQKSKKWPEMTKNYVCGITPYLTKHTSYDRVFLLHRFERIFLKFWFCGLLGAEWVKKAKNGPKWQKILSHFVSQELYLIWLWFLVHVCKIMIHPASFFIFSKFISKCQKKILRCVPPSSCVCDFFVKLWLIILSQLELSRTELRKGTPNILMENCDHTICPVLSILFFMTQPLRLGFLKNLSLS